MNESKQISWGGVGKGAVKKIAPTATFCGCWCNFFSPPPGRCAVTVALPTNFRPHCTVVPYILKPIQNINRRWLWVFEWDVFTKFRAKLPAGRTDWRAFQLAFILYGGRRRRKFGGPLWMEKGQLCSAIAFRSSLGALQKRIHVNLSWSPQEQRVFEETFTD